MFKVIGIQHGGDGLILNKPTIPTKTSDLTNDTGYITGYTETDPIFTAWNKSTGISITKSQVSDLIEATQSLSGLMSATDKTKDLTFYIHFLKKIQQTML